MASLLDFDREPSVVRVARSGPREPAIMHMDAFGA